MAKFAKFICGLCIVVSIWGLVWGVFMHEFLWLTVGGIVMGGLTAPFADEEKN